MLARSVEAFLDDLLEFVEDGKVVPIIGEELLRVRQDGNEIPLYRYIADKLAERLQIPANSLPPEPSLNAVVCHYLQTGGMPGQMPQAGVIAVQKGRTQSAPCGRIRAAVPRDIARMAWRMFNPIRESARDQPGT